jgi:ribosome biogenesis protein Nip4
MTKDPIQNFARQFSVEIEFDKKLTAEKRGRHFLLTEDLRKLPLNDFFFAGKYLGKSKKGKFFPSFNLLRMIACKDANKITVDERTEWLFICGRDVFGQGIIGKSSANKGQYVLVMNKHGDCLGFGKALRDINTHVKGVVIENILDIGDFLRRER